MITKSKASDYITNVCSEQRRNPPLHLPGHVICLLYNLRQFNDTFDFSSRTVLLSALLPIFDNYVNAPERKVSQ